VSEGNNKARTVRDKTMCTSLLLSYAMRTISKWYNVRLSSVETGYGPTAKELNLVRSVVLPYLVVATLVVWFAGLPAHSSDRICDRVLEDGQGGWCGRGGRARWAV